MKRRTFNWLTINGAFAVFIYYALVEKVDWASYIVQCYTWIALIVSIIALSIPVIIGKMAIHIPSAFPHGWWRIADVVYDLAVVAAFIKFGWIFYAVIYFLHICFMQIVFNIAGRAVSRSYDETCGIER
jgi:hypothetical protein